MLRHAQIMGAVAAATVASGLLACGGSGESPAARLTKAQRAQIAEVIRVGIAKTAVADDAYLKGELGALYDESEPRSIDVSCDDYDADDDEFYCHAAVTTPSGSGDLYFNMEVKFDEGDDKCWNAYLRSTQFGSGDPRPETSDPQKASDSGCVD